MPKPVVSTEPSSQPRFPAQSRRNRRPAPSPRSEQTDTAMSSRSAGLGPQHAPESAQGQPDTAEPNATTPSADPSPQAPVPPLARAPWLFQKGNTYGQMRKHHKGRMEKYIQDQTLSGSLIVEFWLALASGQPFPMKRIVRLPMTSEQYAVAVGNATPKQRKIAKKQRRFIVEKAPYYPSVEDIKEAMYWLADRGFGKAPQIVQVDTGDESTGFKLVFRKWEPGFDPATLPEYQQNKKNGKILDMTQEFKSAPNGSLGPVKKNGHNNGQNGHK